MREQTIKQLERLLLAALRELDLGFISFNEYCSTEQGGKIILGRHVSIHVDRDHLKLAEQEKYARVFRRRWCRTCRVYRFERVRYARDDRVYGQLILKFC